MSPAERRQRSARPVAFARRPRAATDRAVGLALASLISMLALTLVPVSALADAFATPEVWGSLRSRYRHEWGTTEDPTHASVHDDDLFEDLKLHLSGIGTEGLSAAATLRYEQDLDGTGDGSPFVDARDHYDGNRDVRLLEGWADYQGFPASGEVRVGRAYRYLVEPLHFDGGEVSFVAPLDGRFLALAGRRVTYDTDPEDELVAGGSWIFRPASHTRVEVSDVYYAKNEANLYVFQELSDTWDGSFEITSLDAGLRELTLNTSWFDSGEGGLEGRDAAVFGSYLYKAADAEDDLRFDLTSAAQLPTDSSKLDRLLLPPLPPFHEWQLDGSVTVLRPSWASLGLTASLVARVFEGSAGAATSNSDFVEVGGGAYVTDLRGLGPIEALDLSLTGLRHEIFRADIPADLGADDLSDTTGEGETAYTEVLGEATLRALGSRLLLVVRPGYRFFDESRTRFATSNDLTSWDVTAYVRYRWPSRMVLTAGYGYLKDLVVRYPGSPITVPADEFPTVLPDLSRVQQLFVDATVHF